MQTLEEWHNAYDPAKQVICICPHRVVALPAALLHARVGRDEDLGRVLTQAGKEPALLARPLDGVEDRDSLAQVSVVQALPSERYSTGLMGKEVLTRGRV